MADEEIVGSIVLSVNGRDVDCASFSPKHEAGRKLVPSMNRTGRARLSTKTTKSTMMSVEVFIFENDDIDWGSIGDGTITIEAYEGSKRETYTGCGVTNVSEQYGDGSEAKRSLEMFAKDVIKE